MDIQREVQDKMQEQFSGIHSGELRIIYKNNKPNYIRDKSGLLFEFRSISKYTGQEERYRLEIEQQFRLADYLLIALQKA